MSAPSDRGNSPRNRNAPFAFRWPDRPLVESGWTLTRDDRFRVLPLAESPASLAADSRWPAFFSAPLCLLTTGDGCGAVLERVVGASIVNRFPYVMALSVCRESLSRRHYPRQSFMRTLERGGSAVVQFLEPGPGLAIALSAIANIDDADAAKRLSVTGLPLRSAQTSTCPVLSDSYLVYEGHLARPGADRAGHPLYAEPWIDVGSHRVYFLEISAIGLRADIADRRRQIAWHSLASWMPADIDRGVLQTTGAVVDQGYWKPYQPHYLFPAANTVPFEAEEVVDGLAYRHLPPLAEDQVEVDNDRARWPCFFPSSVGMITTWASAGQADLMPCGSTTIVSRAPFVVAIAVSYQPINERYAPRASLEFLDRTGRFVCGVPVDTGPIVEAIGYAGNVSIRRDPDKVRHAGLAIAEVGGAPVLPALPISFDCRVIERLRLGTHMLYLGEVSRALARPDLTPDNPITWYPWADVVSPV